MGIAATKPQSNELCNRLFSAINRSNFQEARNIISNGANINCTNFFGGTALIESCRKKEHDEPQRAEFVEFLLENGANISICDMYGSTALLYAEDNGYESIVTILISKENKKG